MKKTCCYTRSGKNFDKMRVKRVQGHRLGLPEVCRSRYSVAFFEVYCPCAAYGTAHPAAIARPLVNGRRSCGRIVADRAKLAYGQARAAPHACVGGYLGDILGTEHKRDAVRHGAHCEAFGPAAIAYGGDKGRFEGPDGVAESFLLMSAESGDSIIFCQKFIAGSIGAIDKTIVDTPHDLGEPASAGAEADGIAVALVLSQCDMAAEAGDPYYGIDQAEDLFDIFDRDDLAEMVLLHLSRNDAAHDVFHKPRCLSENFKVFIRACEPIPVRQKFLDKPAPAYVA